MVKWLDSDTRSDIAKAVRELEKRSSAELRVHVTSRITKPVMDLAVDWFWKNGMHLTARRNGVLIFVASESHEFAIVGDVGIHAKVGESFWNQTRDTMQNFFKKGEFKEGVLAGIAAATGVLALYFPVEKGDRNELSDEVSRD